MSASAANKPRRATQADLEAVPPHRVAEILNGELVVSPRPAPRHRQAASALGGLLIGPFRFGHGGGPGGWVILDEPELHFGPKTDSDVLVPDIAGWRRERMPEIPDEAAITVAPDWCCEVLSRSTETHDRGTKMPIYAREQVKHLWLVDPIAQTLEVYRLKADGWLLLATHTRNSKVRAEPFEAIELELELLWAR